MENFPYFHKLPLAIQEHVEGWINVVADANCGFRRITNAFCSRKEN